MTNEEAKCTPKLSRDLLEKFKVERLLYHLINDFLSYEGRDITTETDREKEIIFGLVDKYADIIAGRLNNA